jgi:hypothetical protein
MSTYALHQFHIPVMGTGHSADTCARVGQFGIHSVVSLVDDLLLEKMRSYYCEKYELPYQRIARHDEDGRARRLTAYLDCMHVVIQKQIARLRSLPFFESNDKKKYFDLLPATSSLKADYLKMIAMPESPERAQLEKSLSERMQPGSIDTNIMVKLDRQTYDVRGNHQGDVNSDAKTSLKGFARSIGESRIIFSAGINQSLFAYMAEFPDFYRDALGSLRKKIVLKVSDFRSALIQGKFLAKKGLEVHEFRIESGLNCGGHAFASNGELLPILLREFKEKRDQLAAEFVPIVEKFYTKMGWTFPETARTHKPLITVQGGIGTHGEVERLISDFGMDATGWASPFLLVPEATPIDEPTRALLRDSTLEDLYLSNVSPLGVPFNNLRNTGSEVWTKKRAEDGKPGSPCPKGFLVSNTEFTEIPICTASSEFQKQKIPKLQAEELPESEYARSLQKVYDKTCICDHLGNGVLIVLGMAKESNAPQSICPGQNIAWFNRYYSLEEMVDHIYGRIPSLVPDNRPHMFAAEVKMYVDYFENNLLPDCKFTPSEVKTLNEFIKNLNAGMDYCLEIAQEKAYDTENLASIPTIVSSERQRFEKLCVEFSSKIPA